MLRVRFNGRDFGYPRLSGEGGAGAVTMLYSSFPVRELRVKSILSSRCGRSGLWSPKRVQQHSGTSSNTRESKIEVEKKARNVLTLSLTTST